MSLTPTANTRAAAAENKIVLKGRIVNLAPFAQGVSSVPGFSGNSGRLVGMTRPLLNLDLVRRENRTKLLGEGTYRYQMILNVPCSKSVCAERHHTTGGKKVKVDLRSAISCTLLACCRRKALNQL
jgi:hypothetical protein